MRVAIVSQPWATVRPPSESVAIWTNEIARRLAADCEVSVYARGDPAGDADVDGVSYRYIRAERDWRIIRLLQPMWRARDTRKPLFASPLYHRGYWRSVAAGVASRRPDVVHVHNFSQLVPLLRRAHPRVATALHMHCQWLNQLDRALVRPRVEQTDVVVGASDWISERIRTAFPAFARRVETLHNGVDVEAFHAGESDRESAILFVGRISPEKGVHVLLEAFERLLARRPNATLELVGPEGVVPLEMGPALDEEQRVRELARFYEGNYGERLRAGLSAAARERVTFAGTVPHAEVIERYRAATVFVLPSVWNEPFGMPVAEAMAAGLPVVASRVGGIPEIVVDGETGRLVPPNDAGALADALVRLLDAEALRRALGEAGRRRAAAVFSWDAIAARLLALYREVTASRARR